MRDTALPLALLGSAALGAAVVLALLPLNADGVGGNAIRPQYSDFGWFSYEPLPERPTTDDLRRAGVAVPQDAVRERRLQAAAAAGTGLVLLAGAGAVRRRG